MKKRKENLRLLIKICPIIALFQIGCSDGFLFNKKLRSTSAGHAGAGWVESQKISDDKSVAFKKSELTPQGKDEMKSKLRQTDLVQIPIDPSYNVTLFKIRNIQEYSKTAFVAPKVYAYGSAEKARISPESHPDGTVTIPFHLAMVSGTESSIESSRGHEKISLPETVLVRNIEKLRAELVNGYEGFNTLSVLPGCPKKIIIVVNGEEFEATNTDLANGDYCAANSPFTASIRVSKERAQYLLQDAIYNGQVEARASYETHVAFSVAKLHIEFQKQKIFEEIEAQFHGNIFWLTAEAYSKVTNIIKSQALKVQIQGEYSNQLSTIVDQSIKEFFVPFNPDPTSPEKSKCENTVCLSLNYNYSKEKQTFEVNWEQSENALTGQVYLTWAKLHPLMDNTVSIGGNPQRPALPNTNGASIETGLTILNGDLLEIIPTKLKIERKQLSIPQVSRYNNGVCVKWRVPRSICSIRMGCDHGGDIDPICSETQNQWYEITTYSNSQPSYDEVDQPIATQQQIFEGLALKFTWRDIPTGQSQEKICPLAVFERVGNGIGLRMKIENQPSCRIFEEANGAVPMLSIVNNISFPQEYLNGRQVVHYNGTISEQPSRLTYFPYVEFSGTITILGYNFGSSHSNINGSRLK